MYGSFHRGYCLAVTSIWDTFFKHLCKKKKKRLSLSLFFFCVCCQFDTKSEPFINTGQTSENQACAQSNMQHKCVIKLPSPPSLQQENLNAGRSGLPSFGVIERKDVCHLSGIMELDDTLLVVLKKKKNLKQQCLPPEIMMQ